MNMIDWLQNWYKENCDGDWEHMFGIRIQSLDNPGWNVAIDLLDTELEDKAFEEKECYIDDNNWFFCLVKDGIFKGAGDADKLEEILRTFKEWADS